MRAFVGPTVERSGGPGREIDFAALIANDGAYVRHPHGPLADEVAVLQYTGGTTGEPKGAMLTHANFSAVLNAYNRWTSASPLNDDDKSLVVLPLFHIFGLSFIMLLSVRIRHADDHAYALRRRSRARRHRAQEDHRLLRRADHVSRRWSIIRRSRSSICRRCGMCASGGAPLPVEVLQRFRELTGVTPREGYGLTETAPLGTMQVNDAAPRAGTVGLPAPHTVIEVVDLETGTRVLPVGEKGEICVTGPQVMKGYWNKPEATADAFRGGRFHTGDIGFIDQDGFVTLVDRKKDMILSGGFNVFPRNIEEAIYEHPAVAEVTVIGIPDAYRGQSAKAFIALKPGQPAFSFDELKAFLADKLAKYEMPTEMEFRASLPKTPVGKLSKKELVAEELAKREAAAARRRAQAGRMTIASDGEDQGRRLAERKCADDDRPVLARGPHRARHRRFARHRQDDCAGLHRPRRAGLHRGAQGGAVR